MSRALIFLCLKFWNRWLMPTTPSHNSFCSSLKWDYQLSRECFRHCTEWYTVGCPRPPNQNMHTCTTIFMVWCLFRCDKETHAPKTSGPELNTTSAGVHLPTLPNLDLSGPNFRTNWIYILQFMSGDSLNGRGERGARCRIFPQVTIHSSIRSLCHRRYLLQRYKQSTIFVSF